MYIVGSAGAVVAAWITVICVAAAAPVARSQEAGAYRPPPPPEQPIAYSHKVHLALGLQCAGCHATAESANTATLPPTTTCMNCHRTIRTDSADIRTLADYDTRKEDVPWTRVYRLPEYVFFSHRVHMPADKSMSCDTCHGDVRDMTIMQKVKDISMAACVTCHTARSAPIRCDVCHEPRG